MANTTSETRQAEARERLQEAVEALATEEGWVRWLDLRARMHGYSLNNLMLIALQRPDATHVAGYKAWQKLGRQVRQGERGIRILAPVVRKVELEDGSTARRVVAFRTVSVFDVAQTEGDPIAERPGIVAVTGADSAGLFDNLVEIVEAEGLTLGTETLRDGCHGYIDRAARRIVLGEHLDAAGRAKTLAHELGHWFDLGPAEGAGAFVPVDRPDAEVVAEAVAYVVTSAAGIDSGAYSAAYVLDWAGGNTDRLAELARRVDQAAAKVLDGAAGAEAEEVAEAA